MHPVLLHVASVMDELGFNENQLALSSEQLLHECHIPVFDLATL